MKRATKDGIRLTAGILLDVLGWAAKIVGTVILIMMTTGAILAVLALSWVNKAIDANIGVDLEDFSLDQTSFVYYYDKNTGAYKELETLYGAENRVWVEYESIPKDLISATVAIEDERFFQHNGVDWYRTAAAFANMFLRMKESAFGGSTITQQLIKNLTDENEVSVKRKIQEILRAMEFDRVYGKETTMEWYLNTIFLGEGCSGVKTAAEVYFNKTLDKLTLAECAALISITNNPSIYDPFINPDRNETRRELVLSKMLELNYIDESEYEEAVNQRLVFVRSQQEAESSRQSYFVDQVINDVASALMSEMNISRKVAETLIYRGGYKIYTTIDLEVQAVIDEVFLNEENYPKVNDPEKPQAAIVVQDIETGDVVGMYGGRGEKKGNRILNRATQAYRQPGSTMKPIAVYAPAVDMGLVSPYSVFDDTPSSVNKNKPWPVDYEGYYSGLMSVMRAVQVSNNAIPVKILDLITTQKSYAFMTEYLGITSLNQEVDTSGLAPFSLGGLTKGMSVRELNAAYCTFANHGVFVKPRTFTKVLDSKGAVLIDNQPETTLAVKEKTAYYMNAMLKNVVDQGTGTRARIKGMSVAGKTGTTTNNVDRWFVGYTPYYGATVWFGFDEPKRMKLVEDRNPALPIWKLVMDKLHENLEGKEFFQIDGIVSAAYCLDSGMAPGEACSLDPRGSRVASGRLHKDDVPKRVCNIHKKVEIDTETNQLATEYCPAESRKTIALVENARFFPMSGVPIGDEQYMLNNQPVPAGMFRYVTPANKDGKPLINTTCELHKNPPEPSETLPEDIPPDDESGWPPDLPWGIPPTQPTTQDVMQPDGSSQEALPPIIGDIMPNL